MHDSSRVLERLHELAQLGRYEAGIDRALATPAERAARDRFAAWARAGGRTLTQDRVGNLFARRAGSDPGAPAILVGSHLDTVKTGGAYDGAYGVVGALCALETLDARKIATLHPLDAVAWVGEEGSRFPLGCLGSAVFAGLTGVDEALALVDDAGIALGDALADAEGGLLRGLPQREPEPLAAYVELHVEQGPIMERAGMRLGIVTAIAGQRRFRVVASGTSGHAGTVPMSIRADALAAAAEIVLALEKAALEREAVVTVGRLVVEPGATNVIPARVTFSVDMRSPDDAVLDALERVLDEETREVGARRDVRFSRVPLERRAATPMNRDLREAIRRGAASTGERTMDVPSGAGHDAMCVAAVAPAAMLFVPSIGGASHVGEERTADDDLELGVEALAAALVEIDRMLGGAERG
ncbi:MAG: Zn-dependent hydrolase [Candidatus Eremiobacteraeota bacterium]|nr:Zn-dependent hydrolase [Candidatus Eremiobacteraeota bacterium]